MACVLAIFILSVDRDSLLGEISIWKIGLEVKGKNPCQPLPTPDQADSNRSLLIPSCFSIGELPNLFEIFLIIKSKGFYSME